MENWQKENCVVYICTVVLILGMYMLGGGIWSWLGLFLLIGLNEDPKEIQKEKENKH